MNLELTAELEAARRVAAQHRTGPVGLATVLVGPSALNALAAMVAGLATSERIVMLEDATPMMMDGADLKGLVAGLLAAAGAVDRVVLGPPDGSLHAEAASIAAATEAAGGAGCLVSVGSGTLTDVAKETARQAGVPLVAVQTAASVNGYADGLAVILRDGVKRTVPSTWPSALLIDTRVLADAPPALTRSGFSEMISMFTAPADWRLAAAAGQDPSFDEAVVNLFRPRGEELLAAAGDVGAGKSDALQLLAVLLTGSGLAMGATGRTAPLSGTEHLISHLLDMSAPADGRRVGLHGAQVGVAAMVAACVWERLLHRLLPDQLRLEPPSPEEAQRKVEETFAALDPEGRMGRECWADYRLKLAAWSDGDRSGLVAGWPALKAELAGMVGDPAVIAAALSDVGAPTRFSLLDPSIGAERARWAVASCHLMRNRFTVVDLAFLTGNWTADDVDAVLARAADLGAGL